MLWVSRNGTLSGTPNCSPYNRNNAINTSSTLKRAPSDPVEKTVEVNMYTVPIGGIE